MVILELDDTQVLNVAHLFQASFPSSTRIGRMADSSVGQRSRSVERLKKMQLEEGVLILN